MRKQMAAIKKLISQYGIKFFGIGLFVIIAYRIDFPQFFVVLKEIDLVLFFSALFLLIPYLFFKLLRWCSILKIQQIEYSPYSIVRIYLSSLFWGVITPGRVGDFTKVIYLKRDFDVPIGKGVSGVFTDRLLDLFFLLFISILGGFLLVPNKHFTYMLYVVLTLILIVLLLVFIKKPSFRNIKIIPDRLIQKGKNTYSEFKSGIFSLLSIKFLFVLLLSMIVFIIFYFQCYFLAKSVGIDMGLMKLSAYISIMSIITLFPISISGIGTRDLAVIYFFSLEGFSKENSVAFSMLFLFIFSVVTALIGLIGWYSQPTRDKDL